MTRLNDILNVTKNAVGVFSWAIIFFKMAVSVGIKISKCMNNVEEYQIDHMELKCQQDNVCQMFRLRDLAQNPQNKSGVKN